MKGIVPGILIVAITIMFSACQNPVASPKDSKSRSESPAASIPTTSDLVGTWTFSYALDSIDDTWIFNSDNTFYYVSYDSGPDSYSYNKGTWTLDASGVLIASQLQSSPTTTAADITTLSDWTSDTSTFSSSTLLYKSKLYMGTYFQNAMSIMTRIGTGSGISGDWTYTSVDGLVKIDNTFTASTFSVFRCTRAASTDAWPESTQISGGTYTVSDTTLTCTVPLGYVSPAGTFQQFIAVSEPYLVSSSSLSGGLTKE